VRADCAGGGLEWETAAVWHSEREERRQNYQGHQERSHSYGVTSYLNYDIFMRYYYIY
jgi:hypothetical protein